VGIESPGIHQMTFDAIMKCEDLEIEIRKQMFGNVVLCGGTSWIPGLVARLSQELHKLVRFPSFALSPSLSQISHFGFFLIGLVAY
jgi:actin-related protein